MKRRHFISSAAAGLAGGLLAGGCRKSEPVGPAIQTNPHVRWRLASSYPRSLDALFGTAQQFVRRLGELTDGRFEIQLYQAGELVPALQVFDAVQAGTVQAGHSASYYYIGKNPIFAFDTTVPFGLTARQQNAWLYFGGGLELLRAAFADFNIINLPGGNTGAQMGGWFKREIRSLAELRGLKMRIPGQGGEVMNRLGVTVQMMSGGEVYPALERGVIDATEWVGPYDDEKLGFYKIAPYYYYPGWWEPCGGVSFYINKPAWESLPANYQQALACAAAEAGQWMLSMYDYHNPQALGRLLQQGVQLRRFPDDLMAEARNVARDILESHTATHPAYRKVYEQWNQFRAQAFRWFGTAELAYGEFAFPTAS